MLRLHNPHLIIFLCLYLRANIKIPTYFLCFSIRVDDMRIISVHDAFRILSTVSTDMFPFYGREKNPGHLRLESVCAEYFLSSKFVTSNCRCFLGMVECNSSSRAEYPLHSLILQRACKTLCLSRGTCVCMYRFSLY
jgi:hypothetical protein